MIFIPVIKVKNAGGMCSSNQFVRSKDDIPGNFCCNIFSSSISITGMYLEKFTGKQ
jgi:hypothetical protein